MLGNRPYLLYLAMRVPMSIFSLIPSNIVIFFLKHNMALEDYSGTYFGALIVAIASGVASVPIMVGCASRQGKSRALIPFLLSCGTIYLACFLIPDSVWTSIPFLIYVMAVPLGFSTAIPFVLPDAILADTIDYDELLTGVRSAGMFTVVETNLQQWVEIVGGVVPLMVFQILGYKPLNGCGCGCGVSCDISLGMPYARWVCDGSVGYTCSDQIGAPLIYQPEPEEAPCATQNDSVNWGIKVFFLLIPSICAYLSVVPLFFMPISKQKHAEILAAIDAGAKGAADEGGTPDEVLDPLSGVLLQRPDLSARAIYQAHFSPREWICTAAQPSKLKALLGARLTAWSLCAAGLLAMMAAVGTDTAVTIGALLLALVFMLMPYDALRLKTVLAGQGTVPGGGTELGSTGGSDTSTGSEVARA